MCACVFVCNNNIQRLLTVVISRVRDCILYVHPCACKGSQDQGDCVRLGPLEADSETEFGFQSV